MAAMTTHQTQTTGQELVSATERNVAALIEFVTNLEAEYGTNFEDVEC